MNELVTLDSGMVQLFGTHVFEARHILLFMLLAAAVAIDVRSHRIPNPFVATGSAIGIAWHLLLPYGWGIAYALKGAAIGLAFFLPMYALRSVGAGDVKLMAMVGMFLGPASTAGAALATLLAGGVLAIVAALYRGVLPQLLANLRVIVGQGAWKASGGLGLPAAGAWVSAGKLPYALAIATGTFMQIVLARSGHALVG